MAKNRNIAPSSVTRNIALLEEDFGFRLFHRTTRKVTPTEEGEKLFDKISQWLDDFTAICSELQGESLVLKGTLRLTTNVVFNHLFLVDLISKFLSQYQDIKLEVQVTDQAVDLIAERIDVAFRFGKLVDSEFIGIKLFNLDYALVASPSYIKTNGLPKRLDEIKEHRCLSFLLNQFHSVWKFRKNNRSHSIKIAPSIKVTGALSLIEYVRRGSGIALLPKRLIQKDLEIGKLVQGLKSYEATPTEFGSAAWMIYPSRDHLPMRSQAFIKFIKSHL